MMYPFLTLDDETEISYSPMQPDGSVKIYVEKPDRTDGTHHANFFLPDKHWEDISGFSSEEIARYQSVIEPAAYLILQFSQK